MIQDLYSKAMVNYLDKNVSLVSFLHATLGRDYHGRLRLDNLLDHSFIKEVILGSIMSTEDLSRDHRG